MSVGYIIVSAVVAIASLVVNLVLASKSKDAAAQMKDYSQDTLADITVTQQAEGLVIPVLYGSGMLSGNIIWWKAENINNDYYRYKMWLTICMGEIEFEWDYYTLWPGGGIYPGSRYNKYSVFVDDEPRYCGEMKWYHRSTVDNTQAMAALTDEEKTWKYVLPFCFMQTGGNTATVPADGANWAPPWYPLKNITTFMTGIYDVNPFFNTVPVNQMTYNIWPSNAMEQGATQLPGFSFFVTRKFNVDEIDDLTFLSYATIRAGSIGFSFFDIIGSNPAIVYYDLLVNKSYGGNIDKSKLNMSSFLSAAIYYENLKYGLNFIISQKVSVSDVVKKIQEWTNSFLTKDENDLYIIKIMKDSDVNKPVAVLEDKDFIEFTIRRKSWEETYNSISGTYYPRVLSGYMEYTYGNAYYWAEDSLRNDYPEVVSLKNEANILLTGSEREKTIDLSCFCWKDAANHRLSQALKQESFPYINGSITTNLKFSFVRPGDVIVINSSEYGITTSFRVTSIDYKEIDSNQISFNILQMATFATVSKTDNSDSQGTTLRAVTPDGLEKLIFNPFDSISQPMSYLFNNDSDVVVYWSTGQLMTGMLKNGVDYTVVGHNKIQLDPLLFSDEIGFNSNGLMSIDVFEAGRIFPAVVIS